MSIHEPAPKKVWIRWDKTPNGGWEPVVSIADEQPDGDDRYIQYELSEAKVICPYCGKDCFNNPCDASSFERKAKHCR